MASPRKSQNKGFYDRLKVAETFIESQISHLLRPLQPWWRKQARHLRSFRGFNLPRASTLRHRPLSTQRSIRYRPDQAVRLLRSQSGLTLASYACGLLGALLSVHDYHHYRTDHFGWSTPFLIAAILFYVVGNQRTR